jgi:hypothetical protein
VTQLLLTDKLLVSICCLPKQGTARNDVNDGIISRPRLLARDPSLFSLLQYIFSPSVVRFRYRAACPNCSSKWPPAANVLLLEMTAAVSVLGVLPCWHVGQAHESGSFAV